MNSCYRQTKQTTEILQLRCKQSVNKRLWVQVNFFSISTTLRYQHIWHLGLLQRWLNEAKYCKYIFMCFRWHGDSNPAPVNLGYKQKRFKSMDRISNGFVPLVNCPLFSISYNIVGIVGPFMWSRVNLTIPCFFSFPYICAKHE